ncbi:MAG: DUF481 domain-containing protein [Nitrospirota bacterium]
MKSFVRLLACITVIALPASAGAQTKTWKDQLELSYVQTGGNSRTQTLRLKNNAEYLFTNRLAGKWLVDLIYGETGGEQNAGHYMTELRLDYRLLDRLFVYGLGGAVKDNFAGIDGRYYTGAGLGYRVLAGPTHTLVVEAGANYNVERYTPTLNPAPPPKYLIPPINESFVMGRFFGKYVFAFTEKSNFSQSVEYLPNLKETIDYVLISETALTAAMTGYLSLKFSYTLKYDQEPAGTAGRTDTIVSAAVVVTL